MVLVDFDPQGSSLEWLAARPQDAPTFRSTRLARGACGICRTFRLRHSGRVPAGTLYRSAELTALVRRAQSIVIPVLPSPTDIRAAAHFIHHLLLVGRVERKEVETGGGRQPRAREHRALQKAAEDAGVSASGYTTVNTQNYQRLDKFSQSPEDSIHRHAA